MLISIFKSNQRIVNAFTGIIALLFWIIAFYNKEGNYLLEYKWVDMLVTVGLISLQSIWMNRIVNNNKLIERTTYLTSLCFVTLASIPFFILSFHQVLLANTFLIAAFSFLLQIYNQKEKLQLIFNASLLMGIASTLYHPYVVFLPFVWFVVIYVASAVWRDFVVSFLGFLVPIIYVAAYYFIFKDIQHFSLEVNFESVTTSKGLTLAMKFLLVFLAALTLIASYALIQVMSRSIVKVRKLLWVVLVMGIFMVSTILLNQKNAALTLASLGVPCSVVFAVFFERLNRSWIAEILYLLLMGNILWVYFS